MRQIIAAIGVMLGVLVGLAAAGCSGAGQRAAAPTATAALRTKIQKECQAATAAAPKPG
jgi:hypothetical protein